jgi:hypothetical protein
MEISVLKGSNVDIIEISNVLAECRGRIEAADVDHSREILLLRLMGAEMF